MESSSNPEWKRGSGGVTGFDQQFHSSFRSAVEDKYPMIKGALVIRHGFLVAQHFSSDFSHDKTAPVYSVTKTVIGSLVGIALENKLIKSLDQKLSDLLPTYLTEKADPRTRTITIRQLLTMTSGFDFDYRAATLRILERRVNNPESAPNSTLANAPGTVFQYDEANPQLLVHVISRVTGLNTADFASKYLFGPLGIDGREWKRDANGQPNGGYGLSLSTNDLAKLALLYLAHGRWNGVQILPQKYCEEATSPQTDGGWPGNQKYGYLTWVSNEARYRAFFALGYGGTVAMGIPELDLAIALMTDERCGMDRINYPRKIVTEIILPSAKT